MGCTRHGLTTPSMPTSSTCEMQGVRQVQEYDDATQSKSRHQPRSTDNQTSQSAERDEPELFTLLVLVSAGDSLARGFIPRLAPSSRKVNAMPERMNDRVTTLQKTNGHWGCKKIDRVLYVQFLIGD